MVNLNIARTGLAFLFPFLVFSEATYGSCLPNPFFVRYDRQVRTFDRIISTARRQEVELQRRLAPLEGRLSALSNSHNLLKCNLEDIETARQLLTVVYGHLELLVQSKTTMNSIREEINIVRRQLVSGSPDEMRDVLRSIVERLGGTFSQDRASLSENVENLLESQQLLQNVVQTIHSQLVTLASSTSTEHLVAQLESLKIFVSTSRISEEQIRQQLSANEPEISQLEGECSTLRTLLNRAKETHARTSIERDEYIRANQQAADRSRFCVPNAREELRRPR